VNLWCIAGETWCVDGHLSGAENSSLCQDLFLRDSHFGNPVCAARAWSVHEEDSTD
jgi:hypothetical protein